jgi:FkbM family methyltransferase
MLENTTTVRPDETRPHTLRDEDRSQMLMGTTPSRFVELWTGRRELRNWWWVLPLAALIHIQTIAAWDRPKWLGAIPVRVRLRSGDRISCRADEILQIIETYISGDYDIPAIKFREVRTILDVGANIGVSTIWFSQRCPMARIFCVEPSSETGARLLRNIHRNALGNRVTVLPIAVGTGSHPVYLVFGENSGLSHTDAQPQDGSEMVWSTDLSTVLELVGGHVDIMKIDCEGAEYEIILGADTQALSQIDNIVGEYHGSDPIAHTKLFSHLENAGFEVSQTFQEPWGVGIFSAVRVPDTFVGNA